MRSTGQRHDASPLADGVYQAVLAKFIAGEIAPEERVTVDGLARELGTSQTPIREALSRLESDGLVVKTHLVGYSAAAAMTAKEFEDLFEIRMILEPHAAAKAAKNRTANDLAAMRRLAQKMTDAAAKESLSYGQFAQLDAALHELVIAACGNDLILDSFVRLHAHLHLFRQHCDATVTHEAIEEHNAVIKAIHGRDSAGSREHMRKHLQLSRDRFRTASF